MPDFTAKIGSFDFSQYVRVEPGGGLDPYDSGGYEDPAFTSSPFSEGQPLANVDVGNREMVFPLYLNNSSKDALHGLVRVLNRVLRYPDGQLTLRWQDQGASDPTFFDVGYARFDPEFSLRQAAQGWLAGTLRVWCRPGYGHTGTYRVVSPDAGSTRFVRVTPTALAGDVEAHVQITQSFGSGDVRTTATPAYPGEFITLVAAIPANASFIPQWSPSQLLSNSLGAASYSPYGNAGQVLAGGAWGMSPISGIASMSPSAYAGRQRILALMRCDAASGYYARLMAGNATALVAETPGLATMFLGLQASNAWRMVDLGVIDVDPLGTVEAIPRFVWGAPVGSSSINTIEVGAMFVLPEERSCALLDPMRPGATSGATSLVEASQIMRSADNYVRRDANPNNPSSAMLNLYVNDSRMLRGTIPDVGPSQAVYVSTWKTGFRDPVMDFGNSVTVAVRERFTFAR